MKGMFDDIRDKLESWEAPEPDGLWDRIETGMSGMNDSRKSSGTIRPVLLRTAAAAGTAAAAVIAMFFLIYPGKDNAASSLIADAGIETELPDSDPRSEDIRPAPGNRSLTVPEQDTVRKPSHSTATTATAESPAKMTAGNNNDSIDIKTDIQDHTVLNSGGLQRPGRDAGLIAATQNNTDPVHPSVATPAGRRTIDKNTIGARRGNRLSNNGSGSRVRTLSADMDGRGERRESAGLFSIGISVANSPGSGANSDSYTGLSGYQAAPMSLSSSSLTALWIDPDASIRHANQSEEVSTDTRYRLPVRTGVSLRFRLPSGVGFETGITYTWLSSTMKSGSEHSHYISTTQMHYIGIPLNVSYTFWDSRILDIYASVGGLMEKCIGGNISTEYTIQSQNIGSERTETLSIKPLQWAVNATAGIQVNITPAIGLYAEPGAVYYFDDGTDLRTTYKASPFNFYLRFGLRFSLDL